jgi:2-oxopent-4-enoate/cis-2-oxohex-4-enoate hydratase
MLSREIIDRLSIELYRALREQKTLSPLTERYPSITIDDAYQVSLGLLEHRVASGETMTGKKIGITSQVVQNMFNVQQPDFGFLTDVMQVKNNAKVSIRNRLIQPKAEGEIAFILNKDLVGPHISEDQVLDATAFIVPCFEVVDSRIRNWEIKIEDTISDNASCGVYVLGDTRIDPRDVDLPNLKMKVYKNGNLISEGMGAAVQGNPLTAVAWLANTLSRYGIPFKAGETILSGSLVPLETVKSGDKMHLELEQVGTASVSFV